MLKENKKGGKKVDDGRDDGAGGKMSPVDGSYEELGKGKKWEGEREKRESES